LAGDEGLSVSQKSKRYEKREGGKGLFLACEKGGSI